MSETCYYHPEAKAKSTCPECTMPICDRCRLDGDMQRCGNCASFNTAEGATAEAVVPAAGPVDDYQQPMCTNHANLAADMQCLNCFRPFCLSCASTGYCPDCAPQFVNRQGAAQMASAASPPLHEEHHAGVYEESSYGFDEAPSMDMNFDLAGSYMTDDTGVATPPRPPRPKKRPEGAPAKKGAPAKGGKKPAAKKGAKQKSSMGPMAAGVLVLIGLAGGGYYFMSQRGAAADGPAGPTKATITSPMGPSIAGAQTIKVKVASPEAIDHLDIMIDGKLYGPHIKKPPFETDWPTNLGQFPNGKHKVTVKAFYKGGKAVSDAREFNIQNKF